MFGRQIQLTDQKIIQPLHQLMDFGLFGHSITTIERLKDQIYVVRKLYGLRILIDYLKLIFLGESSQVLYCEYVFKTRRQNVDLAFSQLHCIYLYKIIPF